MLRDYQLEAVQKITDDWRNHAGVLLVMATGGGKTQVFCELLDRLVTNGRRGLVLVHRRELVEQARDRLLAFWPRWAFRTGMVMANDNQVGHPMVFATVQTLASERRLAQLLAHGPIDYLITDEAHHATAGTYQKVYTALGEANPGLRHLGVTATPKRADGAGLRAVFEKTSAVYDIRFLVRRKYLVPPRWLAIQTGISLAEVATRRGDDGERDYSAKQLADVYETSNCFELVVRTHQQYAAERQAVAFTTTVAGAMDLAEHFNAAGIAAAHASATTPPDERRRILDAFRAGRTRVLCNVGLYTEGLDVPEVSCIHQVRPTQSDALYIQMVGRALRLFPGKTDALILDYAPLEAREIVMLGDVLGTPARKEAVVADRQEEGDVLGGFTFDGEEFHWLEGSPAEIVTRQLNYLDASPWRWHLEDGWLTLGLGKGHDGINRIAVISRPNEQSLCTLIGLWKRDDERAWHSTPADAPGYQGDFDAMKDKAEAWAEKYATVTLTAKGRSWNAAPPTDTQTSFARRLGIHVNGQTKGELSNQITHALARQTLRSTGLWA